MPQRLICLVAILLFSAQSIAATYTETLTAIYDYGSDIQTEATTANSIMDLGAKHIVYLPGVDSVTRFRNSIVPAGYDSALPVNVSLVTSGYWVPASGDVKFKVEVFAGSVRDAADPPAPQNLTTPVATCVAVVSYHPSDQQSPKRNLICPVQAPEFAPGGMLRVEVSRLGTDPEDSSSGYITLISVELDYPLASQAQGPSGPFSASVYDQMRAEFLNVDPNHAAILKISDLPDEILNGEPWDINRQIVPIYEDGNAQGISLADWKTSWPWQNLSQYSWCTNVLHGTTSWCKTFVGLIRADALKGTLPDDECGQEQTYPTPDTPCQPPHPRWDEATGWFTTPQDDGSYGIWLQISSNQVSIPGEFFDPARNSAVTGSDQSRGPNNRLCVEIEYEPGRIIWDRAVTHRGTDLDGHAGPGVNPVIEQSSGMYFSTYKDDTKMLSNESGGGRWTGYNAHPYQQTSLKYGQEAGQRHYMIQDGVVVTCITPYWTAVRGGNGPFADLSHVDWVRGVPFNGIDYMTRVWFSTKYNRVKFPFVYRVNSISMLYEPNDIQALNDTDDVVCETIAPAGTAVSCEFTVWSWAPEDRTYRAILQTNKACSNGNLPVEPGCGNDKVKLYRVMPDESEVEIPAYSHITIPAGEDWKFKLWQNNDMVHQTRHGYDLNYAHVYFREQDRMRATQFSMRRFFGSGPLPSTSKYADPGNEDWETYKQFNDEKANNMRLYKNNPDYQRALIEKAAG